MHIFLFAWRNVSAALCPMLWLNAFEWPESRLRKMYGLTDDYADDDDSCKIIVVGVLHVYLASSKQLVEERKEATERK